MSEDDCGGGHRREGGGGRGRGQGRGRGYGRGGARGRGRGRGRGGRGRNNNHGDGGRGRSGGGGGRGRGGYDWTKHLPSDHPMRRGLGPDPAKGRGRGRAASSFSHHDNDGSHDANSWGSQSSQAEQEYVAQEYAAYHARREARREEDRMVFQQVAAHADDATRRVREEQRRALLALVDGHNDDNNNNNAADGDDNNEGGDAIGQAARRAVAAMSPEEREAALVRHEERMARTKDAFDPNPDKLHVPPHVRRRLQTSLDALHRTTATATATSSTGQSGKNDNPQRGGYGRKRSSMENAAYFVKQERTPLSCAAYKELVQRRIHAPAYQTMQRHRENLPAYRAATSIANRILDPKVAMSVVSGATGSGKTTQIPRALAETAALHGQGRLNILVAQPRRIAAVGVAERVAEEGGTGEVGSEGCDAGYHIRHEKRVGKAANIVFATTGVVLRLLAADPTLRGTDVVIIDEAHERSSEADFLIATLRGLVTGRERGAGSPHPLRLVLCSATVNSEEFASYLKDGNEGVTVPIIHVEGRAHPVASYYLEDAVHAIQSSGAGKGMISVEDMFELDTGKRRRNRYGRGKSGNGHGARRGTSRGNDDEAAEEEEVRSLRKKYVQEKYDEVTAEFVDAFDRRAKIPAKDLHLKSISSGDLPMSLIFRLTVHLDRTNRKQDHGNGAILVFLPGTDDLGKLAEAFDSSEEADDLHVITIHGSMPTSEQRRAFRPPPGGKRKVVIATNVAESSITIEDVVHVIDCGKAKEITYDPSNNIQSLLPSWISMASVRQRRGRAGRVRAGDCWHLFPSWYGKNGVGVDDDSMEEKQEPTRAFPEDVKLSPFALPEMLRTPLEDVCLRVRSLGLAPPRPGGIETFLGRCPTPPGPISLHNALAALGDSDLMLLDSTTEELTPLGGAVASLPIAPRLALSLIFSEWLDCKEEMLTISAILSGRSPFYAPMELKAAADKAKRNFAEGVPSDLLANVQAYNSWVEAERKGSSWSFCRENFISQQAFKNAEKTRRQLARELQALHIATPTAHEESRSAFEKWGRVCGVLSAAFGGSHLARIDHKQGKCRCPIYVRAHGRVKLFPSCISSPDGAAKDCAARGDTYYLSRFGIYMEKIRNKAGINLYDLNEISAFATVCCTPGERLYSSASSSNKHELMPIKSTDGKTKWPDAEVEAMSAQLKELRQRLEEKSCGETEKVTLSVDIEDIETRLGIIDAVMEDKAVSGSGSTGDINDRLINFIISALETNGGVYGMAALRKLLKADYELYEAMGPVRPFAENHQDVLSLMKMDGKWMFVLNPGYQRRGGGDITQTNTSMDRNEKLFWGPKSWVYFDCDGDGQDDDILAFINQTRRAWRDIVDGGATGQTLTKEEKSFLNDFGWALQEDWKANY